MSDRSPTQRERAMALLGSGRIMRLHELVSAGIAATTVSRLATAGEIVRLGRGLYHAADADFGGNQVLAEVAKAVPKGVICLLSALAHYELTDRMPGRVWVAIGQKDWKPNLTGTLLRVVRMPNDLLRQDVERHTIEGVSVPIFSIPRTLADCFRHQRGVELSVAVEAMGQALRKKRTTPAAIAAAAEKVGSWKVIRPYLETLTING